MELRSCLNMLPFMYFDSQYHMVPSTSDRDLEHPQELVTLDHCRLRQLSTAVLDTCIELLCWSVAGAIAVHSSLKAS